MGEMRVSRDGAVVAALVVLAATACGTRPAPTPTPATSEGSVQALNREIALAATGTEARRPPDYRIGPDDLLEVTLFDVEGRNGEPRQVDVRVSQSGSVTLPLVGQVELGGQTAAAAETALREHFRRFIRDPQIAVFVKEYRSYRVSVVGYVEKPGVFDISGERSLLEILAMAGGLNDRAGKTVQVTRRHPEKLETLLVDLDRLAKEGDTGLNLTMMPGDVVNVPKAGVVYVQGSVKKPGAYRLRDAMTLTQAISAAGGPDEKLANANGTRLFRRGANGDRQEVGIDMGDINRGKVEDVMLVENDIVVVPMSVPRYVVDRFIGGIGMGLSIPVF
jgi:polysaccharide export outer membrane protein